MKKLIALFSLLLIVSGGIYVNRHEILKVVIEKNLQLKIDYSNVYTKGEGFFIDQLQLSKGPDFLFSKRAFFKLSFDISKWKVVVYADLENVNLEIHDWAIKNASYIEPKVVLTNTKLKWKGSEEQVFEKMYFDFQSSQISAQMKDQLNLNVHWDQENTYVIGEFQNFDGSPFSNVLGLQRMEGLVSGKLDVTFSEKKFSINQCNIKGKSICIAKDGNAIGMKDLNIQLATQRAVTFEKIFCSFRDFQGYIQSKETELIFLEQFHYKKGTCNIDLGNINPMISASFENYVNDPFLVSLRGFIKPVGATGWLCSLDCKEDENPPYAIQLHYFPKEKKLINMHAFIKVSKEAIGETIWQLGRCIDSRWKNYFFHHKGFQALIEASFTKKQLQSLEIKHCKVFGFGLMNEHRDACFSSKLVKMNCVYSQSRPFSGSLEVNGGKVTGLDKSVKLVLPFHGSFSVKKGILDKAYFFIDEPDCRAHLDINGLMQTGVFSCKTMGGTLFAFHKGLQQSFHQSQFFCQASIQFDEKIHIHGNISIENKEKSNGEVDWHLNLPIRLKDFHGLSSLKGSMKIRNMLVGSLFSALFPNADMFVDGVADLNFRLTQDKIYCSYHLLRPSFSVGYIKLEDPQAARGLITYSHKKSRLDGSIGFSKIEGSIGPNQCIFLPKMQCFLKNNRIIFDPMPVQLFDQELVMTGKFQFSPFLYRFNFSQNVPLNFAHHPIHFEKIQVYGTNEIVIVQILDGRWNHGFFGGIGFCDYKRKLLGIPRMWAKLTYGNRSFKGDIQRMKYDLVSKEGSLLCQQESIHFTKEKQQVKFGSYFDQSSFIKYKNNFLQVQSYLKKMKGSLSILLDQYFLFAGTGFHNSWSRFIGKVECLDPVKGWLKVSKKSSTNLDVQFEFDDHSIQFAKLNIKDHYPFIHLRSKGKMNLASEILHLQGMGLISGKHFLNALTNPIHFQGKVHYFYQKAGYLLQGEISQPKRLYANLLWHENKMILRKVHWNHPLGVFEIPKVIINKQNEVYIPLLRLKRIGLFPYGKLRPFQMDQIELIHLQGNKKTGFQAHGKMQLTFLDKSMAVLVDYVDPTIHIKDVMGCDLSGGISRDGKVFLKWKDRVITGDIFVPKIKTNCEKVPAFDFSEDLFALQ